MKKAIIALIIVIAVTTATASYQLLTPPDPPRNFAELSEDSTANGGSPALHANAVTLPDYPADTNLGRLAILPIVTASALDSEGKAEEAEEGEDEDEKEKEAEEGGPDRMWGAVKLG